jgi:hypothetical protein
MEEKKKRKRFSKKQKEAFNFVFMCLLLDLAWYLLLTSQSLIWIFLFVLYSAWVMLSGIRLINMERFPAMPPSERFQAEIINGRQTVFPEVHKMKSFVIIDDAENWAKEQAENNESWRIIDLDTGREIRKPKQG